MDQSDLILRMGAGNKKKTERIRLADPPVLGAGMPHFFRGRKLKTGQAFRFPLFDPSTLSQKNLELRVMGEGSLIIQGIPYKAFRLEGEMWGQKLVFWLDQEGSVLKEQGFMGLTLVKSSSAKAPRGVEGSRVEDFYDMAAVPLNKELKEATRLAYLKVKVRGLDLTPFDTRTLNRGRQRLQKDILEITREKVPLKYTFRRPLRNPPKALEAFIQPQINIESDGVEIIRKAEEIAGKTENPLLAARLLLQWVYRNVDKRPVVSIPSAAEVMKTRVGDCNEHAVLLAALLRASGIPARICTGLVYARGKFFYHAWVECFTGTWISMDAAMNQMPVDATHIKLVEGGLDKQVEILGLMGKLDLEVLDTRY